MKPTDLPARIAARIRIDDKPGHAASPCWLWIGAIGAEGYGRMRWPVGAKVHVAHRVVWELLKNPIPDGLVLDHLCKVRACVNPLHLEVVTRKENSRRAGGNKQGAWNTTGFCRNGKHLWIPANIYTWPSGKQKCRRCQEEAGRRFTAAGKGRKSRPGPGQTPIL